MIGEVHRVKILEKRLQTKGGKERSAMEPRTLWASSGATQNKTNPLAEASVVNSTQKLRYQRSQCHSSTTTQQFWETGMKWTSYVKRL